MAMKNVAAESSTEVGKTAKYFKLMYKYIYLLGWPNYWTSQPDLPAVILEYHDNMSIFYTLICIFFVGIELAGLYTQNNLSEKQKSDLIMFCFSHIFLGSYGFILAFYQKTIRVLTYSLTVELKKQYNDNDIEKEMVKKARRHSIAYLVIVGSALLFYALDGLMHGFVVKENTLLLYQTTNMEADKSQGRSCKTTEYFGQLCKFLFLIGWPNFWQAEHDLPTVVLKYHDIASKTLNVASFAFVALELIGFFTQTNLSEKQQFDRQLFGFSHIFLGSYGIFLTFNQETIRALINTMVVELKMHYSDVHIETEMTKKARKHSIAYSFICGSALVSYGLDGFIQCCFDKDGTFVTVITAWPDVNDVSTTAGYFRVIAYILWWIFMIRVSGIYVMLISTLVCLACQYKNLQSYFYNLDNIFKNDEQTLREKEEKYENGVKLGIHMHARTLWCTRVCESSFMGVVTGQIVVNVTVIILLMAQMLNSERTFGSVAAIVSTMTAMLISTGYFMWNAGDIAVEAAALSTAMFSSGWHNCQGASSVRVRKLLVIAMTQAQVPVSIRALGIITLSYESYVSIVKSSYSVFSVLY